jgi:hypothetical protein
MDIYGSNERTSGKDELLEGAQIQEMVIGLADILEDYFNLLRLSDVGRLDKDEVARLYLYRNALNEIRITIKKPKPKRAPFVITDRKASEVEYEERVEAKLDGESKRTGAW